MEKNSLPLVEFSNTNRHFLNYYNPQIPQLMHDTKQIIK